MKVLVGTMDDDGVNSINILLKLSSFIIFQYI